MFMIETDDKSYFTDELEKLTSESRSYWTRYTLSELKERLKLEIGLNHDISVRDMILPFTDSSMINRREENVIYMNEYLKSEARKPIHSCKSRFPLFG